MAKPNNSDRPKPQINSLAGIKNLAPNKDEFFKSLQGIGNLRPQSLPQPSPGEPRPATDAPANSGSQPNPKKE